MKDISFIVCKQKLPTERAKTFDRFSFENFFEIFYMFSLRHTYFSTTSTLLNFVRLVVCTFREMADMS